jgi:hypothetical protein
MAMRAQQRRVGGIRRSWLAIGLATTSLLRGVRCDYADIGATSVELNPPHLKSIWTESKERRAAIRRERRMRITQIRELKLIDDDRESQAMFDETFELLFRDLQMSMTPVSKTQKLDKSSCTFLKMMPHQLFWFFQLISHLESYKSSISASNIGTNTSLDAKSNSSSCCSADTSTNHGDVHWKANPAARIVSHAAA